MNLFFPKEFSRNPDYQTPPVAHEVPIATVRDNLYVLNDGSLAACFRIEGMEYELASDRETATFVERLQSVLNTVRPGMQLKLLHRITHNYRDLLEEHAETLDGENPFARYVAWDQMRRYYRSMQRGELLNSENIMVLTYNPKVAWWEADNKLEALMETLDGMLLESSNTVQRTLERYRMALRKFEDMIRPVVNQMGLAGLEPDRLENQELYELAWKTLNPQLSLKHSCPEIQKPNPRDPYAGIFADSQMNKLADKRPDVTVVAPLSEREQLCASDWYVGDKWVRIGEKYYAAISLRMLPTHVYPGMAVQLAGLPFEATIAMDAVMLQKEKELEKQWSQARSDESKSQATLFGGTPDPAEQQKANEKRQRYLQLSASHENPFQFRMTITVSADTRQKLDQHCDAVISLLRNMRSAQAQRAHYEVDNLLKTTWPFSPITDINSRKAMTSEISALMPAFSRWEGSTRPVSLVMDKMNRLVKHDPFPADQLNRNKTICGKSGAGKSFAAQLADIQPHAARDDTEILIVESGGSFELTTRTFGGIFLQLGPNSDYTINPFDLPPGFENMDEEQQEVELRYKYGFIKNLVLAMVDLKDPEQKMLAENVVGSCAQRTYARKQQPRFRDFYKVLGEYTNERDPRAEEVAGRLRTLLTNYVVTEDGEAGIYSDYFDTYTNFDVEAPIIDFDLTDIKNDEALLVPMTMVVIMNLIYNRIMKKDEKDRLVVVDEAWALIKEEAGEKNPAGEGIELFWREGRKLGASSALISQNYSDMTQDAVGQAVVGNSPIQYFLVHEQLQQNDDAFRAAGFSKDKMERVYNLQTKYGEFSEIMIKEGEEWGVIRLPSVGIKYWLATTDPQDLKIRRRYMKTYRDGYGLDEKAVIAILAEDYPKGTHVVEGTSHEMNEQDALVYAENWMERFQRFTERVEAGETIPPDFE